MSILDPIRSAVAMSQTVVAGAIALLTDLGDRLEAALADDDLEAVQELAAELRAQTDSLAAAVAENTIAADEGPTPEPAPEPEVVEDTGDNSGAGTTEGEDPVA